MRFPGPPHLVVTFQYRGDAMRFHAEVAEQMRTHGLALHPEKTRLIEFGRFAEQNRKRRGDGPPDTFDFLGFTPICARSRAGKFFIKRRTVAKKMRATLTRVEQELRLRMHEPLCSWASADDGAIPASGEAAVAADVDSPRRSAEAGLGKVDAAV